MVFFTSSHLGMAVVIATFLTIHMIVNGLPVIDFTTPLLLVDYLNGALSDASGVCPGLPPPAPGSPMTELGYNPLIFPPNLIQTDIRNIFISQTE